MNKSEEFGPEDPRPWDLSHPSLGSPSPHETAGVMRIHRTGKSGADLMVTLRMKGTALMKELQKAMNEEDAANKAGRPIHDAGIPKGTR